MEESEIISWDEIKQHYLVFHGILEFTEKMALDIDFGYYIANSCVKESIILKSLNTENLN